VRRPLVAVTRHEAPDHPLGLTLARGGVDVAWLPTTAILPPLDAAPLDAALARIHEMDWLVFTSGHGVDGLCSRPAWEEAWAAAPARPRVAAVGERTGEHLVSRGLRVDVVPDSPGASGLVAAIVAGEGGTLGGRRVLWPRSDIARPELKDGLAGAGASVFDPVAYRTVAAAPADVEWFRAALVDGGVDAVCFLSPSAASGLVASLGSADLAGLHGRLLVASLGPTTSEALTRLGAPPDVEASPATAERLAEALLARLSVLQGASR